MTDIKIIDAVPEDAPLIAWAVMEAVGDEIVSHLAGEGTGEDVRILFTRLAERPDSQYSWMNTRLAVLPDGTKAGICISYDGGKIIPLRRSFFEEAGNILGWSYTTEEADAFPGETNGEEFYLDSLAVRPEYRGKGIGRLLIRDAALKAEKIGLPLGLLVADDNPQARRLYDDLGFRVAGRRWFAGEEMTNLRL